MLQRRLAAVISATALLVVGCAGPSLPHLSPDVLLVTAGGSALVDGDVDVPPDLQLHLSATPALKVADVHLNLDGRVLGVQADGDGVTARSAPLPLGSAHRLRIEAGPSLDVAFHVVPPTAAMAAFHGDGQSRSVLDLAFASAPSRPEVEAALPGGGERTWTDARHLREVWQRAPGGRLQLPGDLPTARGSHLAATLRLDLGPPSPGGMHTVVVPPAAERTVRPTVVAFTVDTMASRQSLAAHAQQVSVVSPTGWLVRADGRIEGTPDAAAVLLAPGPDATRVWPLLQNFGIDKAATSRLLHDDVALGRLTSTVVDACRRQGLGGATLDFEGVSADDRDALSALAERLGTALHRDGRHFGVAVIPHKPARLTSSSAAYDVPRLGRVADLVTLMAYDQHTEGTGPGPVAGLDWDVQVLRGSLSGLPAPHTLLGMPLYSRAWDGEGRAVADSFPAAVSNALHEPGAVVDMDFDAMTKVIRSGSGVTWVDDADSLARKLQLADAEHLGGIAVWRLGFEDPAFWQLLPDRAPVVN